jgi:hypothetical protein
MPSEGVESRLVAPDPLLQGLPAPDLDVDATAELCLLLPKLHAQQIHHRVVRPGGDDVVLRQRRRDAERLFDLGPHFGLGQPPALGLELALDADGLAGIAPARAKKIPTVLTFGSSRRPQNRKTHFSSKSLSPAGIGMTVEDSMVVRRRWRGARPPR